MWPSQSVRFRSTPRSCRRQVRHTPSSGIQLARRRSPHRRHGMPRWRSRPRLTQPPARAAGCRATPGAAHAQPAGEALTVVGRDEQVLGGRTAGALLGANVEHRPPLGAAVDLAWLRGHGGQDISRQRTDFVRDDLCPLWALG
jgi:hypothetical protein